MHRFIFLLFLCLYVQESNAGKTDGSSDSDEETLSKPTISKPNSAYLDFSDKVKTASLEHGAYAYPRLLKDFNELEVPESVWEEIASEPSIEKWPSQSSWKVAVGAQCFIDAAIDIPHQNLLRNVLRTLLSWSFKEGGLENIYAEATSKVHEIIQTHPYLRRRAALYALTAAAHLQHPLARLFLTEALRFYDDTHDRFFRQNHSLVKLSLSSQEGQEALHIFISLPGIEDFVDLKDESDLKAPEKLREMASLGLSHYNVLLGEVFHKKARGYFTYTPEIIDPVIGQYKEAADQGDSDACLKVANLMSYVANEQVKSIHPLEKRLQYKFLAAWHGNEEACSYNHIGKILNQKNIPDTAKGIFKEVKSFLTPKHRQQISLENIKIKKKKVKSFLHTIPELL